MGRIPGRGVNLTERSGDDHPFPLPPEEAYGRLTNPEGFAPLHDFAAELLDRLEAAYQVQRELVHESEYPEWRKIEFVKPVVRLRPLDPTEAPSGVHVAYHATAPSGHGDASLAMKLWVWD